MPEEMYTRGEYLQKNPTWHLEDSPWKADQIFRMIQRCNLTPKSICEVGCGVGEILKQLQDRMDEDCTFCGYEISGQAFDLCQQRANEKLTFKLGDILQEPDAFFDLMLLIDLIEHLEDYMGFLRKIKPKSTYKIFHIPLDLSVQIVLRCRPLIHIRQVVGHIHYFTKEIALQALKDAGYDIIDHFYTAGQLELLGTSTLSKFARLPRRILFALHQDLAVRLLGGYSLMVLAR